MNKRGLVTQINNQVALRSFGNPDPAVRLICFPFIAGNSIHFRRMARYLPADWQLCAVDPPGHGLTRSPLLTDMREITALYIRSLGPWFEDSPCCLFGHSLGGIIAYVLTLELEKIDKPPQHLFISASLPPDRMAETFQKIEAEDSDEDYLDYMLETIDPRYKSLKHNGFSFFYRPLFFSDYKLLRSLRPEALRPVHTPGYVLYSKEDALLDSRYIEGWKDYLLNSRFYRLRGNHNFILTDAGLVMKTIAGAIAPGK